MIIKAFKRIKDDIDRVRIQKEYVRRRTELEEERRKAERMKAEEEALNAEYDRLLDLDDKQLMTELIFAVRGFYSEMESIKVNSIRLSERLDELEDEVGRLESELSSFSEE